MVVGVGVVVAAIAAAVALRVPDFDPGAPRVPARAVAEEAARHPRAGRLAARLDPERLTGLALTVALAVVVLGVVAIGSLLVMFQHDAGLAHFDLSAARWGARHATPTSTSWLHKISLFGGTNGTVVLAVVGSIVAFVRTRTWAVFAFVATAMISESIVMNLVKWIVDRPRPNIDRLTGFSGSSFPSGHAAAAAVTLASLALLLGRGRSRRAKALLAGVAAGIAASVAATRVLLGVHWLTDVLAGLALGWTVFALVSIAFGGRLLRFGVPVAAAETVVDARPLEVRTHVR